MANNSADLEETLQKLQQYTRTVEQSSRSLTIAEQSKRNTLRAEAEYNAAQAKLGMFISNRTDELMSLTTAISNSGNSFEAINSAIDITVKVAGGLASIVPVLGTVVKKAIGAAGEAAKFLVDSFSNAYAQFEKLSDVGIVGKFEDMQRAGAAMSLNFADTATVLKKYSSALAGMEGSAERGRLLLEQVSRSTQASRDEFRRIGVSAADFTDMVASSMEFENRARPGMQADVVKSAKDGIQYAKNLDTLSKLTGVSRKELQNQRIELLRDAKYRAGIANLDKPIRDNINDLLQQVGAVDKEYADGLKDLIAGDGNPGNSEKAKAVYLAMQQGGIDVQEYIRGMKNGSIKATAGFDKLAIAAKKNTEQNRDLTSKIGTNSIVTRLSIAENNLAARAGQKIVDQEQELTDEQKKNLTDGKSETAKLADTATSMYKTGQMIEQMATVSSTATVAMKTVARGIELATSGIYDLLRVEKPEYLIHRQEEARLDESIDKLNIENKKLLEEALGTDAGKKLQAEGKSPLTGSAASKFKKNQDKIKEINEKLEIVRKKREEADKRLRGTSPTTPTPSAAPAAPGAGEVPPPTSGRSGGPVLTTIRSKEGLTASVAKEAAGQLQGILDYFGKVGYPVRTLYGYNDRNIANTNIKSQHAHGYAIDVNPAQNPYGPRLITDMPAGTGAAAASLGLGWGANWPNVKDAMHFSVGGNEGGRLRARTGGIFSGPESGYAVELHDDEAVVNLDGDGVSQRSLNTSELPANDDEKMMIELFNMMAQKLETATAIVSDGTSKQRIYTTFNG